MEWIANIAFYIVGIATVVAVFLMDSIERDEANKEDDREEEE